MAKFTGRNSQEGEEEEEEEEEKEKEEQKEKNLLELYFGLLSLRLFCRKISFLTHCVNKI